VRGALAQLDGVLEAFTSLQTTQWDVEASQVEARVKEIARLRNARVTDCAY
jgi:hypothetical protein